MESRSGVAFQSYSGSGAENIGYAVPVTLVKRFLKDIRDGAYHGVPDLGVYRQNMEGESLRGRCGLNAADPGVLVTKVVYGSSSWGLLREGDILAGLDGVPIERDGTVSLDGRIRVNFSHLVSMHEMGDVVKAAVVREGRRLTVAIPLKKSAGLVSGPEHDVHPTYFIFAGLVFIPLGYDYMSQWPWKDVEPRFRHYYSDVLPTQSRKQVVLISQVLAHDVNVGYHKWGNVVVEKINGRPITEMRDVIAAFEHPLGRHHVIEVDNHAGGGQGALDYYSNFGTQIVIDAEAAKRSGAEILARYSVPADRSPDLKP
ncbi:MAG: hypothetical protein HY077_01590 [Elusimicrobia bacterium]|nr:hypothetical protein [Elusimicrobiota bacterium]